MAPFPSMFCSPDRTERRGAPPPMPFRWGDMPTPPEVGKLTCPKCQKPAKRHCPTSLECDLVVCEAGCGQGVKDGHLWSKVK